jgi:hypothetical protein
MICLGWTLGAMSLQQAQRAQSGQHSASGSESGEACGGAETASATHVAGAWFRGAPCVTPFQDRSSPVTGSLI